jgi:hypothetical protein
MYFFSHLARSLIGPAHYWVGLAVAPIIAAVIGYKVCRRLSSI